MSDAADARRAPNVRRILLPLDASRESFVALDSAVLLASRLNAQIEALFVEDDNLLRAANLSCSRVVHLTTARISDLDRGDMERELRLAARSARAALVAAATRANFSWSFRVDRGDVTAKILAAAHDADLVIMGRTSRRLRDRPRLGSTAQRLVDTVPAILIAGVAREQNRVACLFDGSELSERVLELAVQASQRDGGRLLILLANERANRERAEALTNGRDLQVEFIVLQDLHLHTLRSVLHRLPGELLVLPAGFPALEEKGVDAVVAALDMPVQLVRD